MADKLKKEKPELKESTTKDEIKFDVATDVFSPEERKDLLKIIRQDVEFAERVQKPYIDQKVLDLKHYHSEKPSILENLTKKAWQSDRNLGLSRAIADSFQATLLATCWNPDSINFIANTASDIDNKVNQEKFTKWGMGKQEANAEPEVDAFIQNRIVVGTSFFKVYRKVWQEWVDKRIPVKNKQGETYKWEIKTEKVTLEKGVIENIADIDDILMPEYGKNIQELPFFIQRLHVDGEDVLDFIERNVFKPGDKEAYKKKLYNHAFKDKERAIGEEKLKALGITPDTMTDIDIRRLSIDLYEWYGYYTKGQKTEKYRIIVDLINEEFLSGKPLRKISRSGRIPFTGGALAKEPGQIRGMSLMQIIAPVVNAFNNVFNQKSDFQYVTNCPFGFHNPQEGYQKQVYELEPMVSFPVEGKPNESVYFPNLSRSMAWAESDLRILFEVLERLTGAATYFQSTNRNVSGTATRDMLVDKNSETRFGLWVNRIIGDICEAIDMWFEIYQDYPPKGLAERVVGIEGKQLFPNLSIDSLRGDNSVQMTPDVVAGSKNHKKELQLWAFQVGQTMLWLNPQVNPAGNWNLCADTLKEVLNLSESELRRYMPEKPKSSFDQDTMDEEWRKFMNGEDFEPPEGATQLAMQHLEGHMKQKEEKYADLAEEYRPNFDAHVFKTTINVMKFMRQAQQEQIANQIASNAIMTREAGIEPQPGQPTGQSGMEPVQPAQPMLPGNTPGNPPMGGNLVQ